MDWTLSKENTLAENLALTINPFWKAEVRTGEFIGKDNVTIAWAWCAPTGATHTIIISSGRIEGLLKYKEVIYDLFNNGFAVFILDHRGQGMSGRMTKNPHHGYVSDFSDYVEDMHHFIDTVVEANRPPGNVSLLCHSMGGAIGALAVMQRPDYFHRVVFCSPMFGIRPDLPRSVARLLIALGLKRNSQIDDIASYFFGQKDYHPRAFDSNKLTGSEVRYRLFRELYDSHPQIQLGGVTTQWLVAALDAMDSIETHARHLPIPALLFSAGNDKVVDNRRQKKVADNFPCCEFITVAGARHELLIETDAIRDVVLTRTMDFLCKH